MSRKRSYCVFAALYFPHLGGLERYTHNLTKRLKERGNQVVIVTSNVYHLKPYEKIEGIHIYRVPCFNILDGRYPVLKLNRQFWKIYRRLRQYQFDMVIVNTRFYFHSLYGMLLARMEKAKCITIDHGTTHLSVHSRFWDTIGEVYEHFLTAIGKQLCKDYYGVSKASCAWLKHFHIKAKGVLYNSIDVDEVEKIRSNTHYSFRTQYHIPTDAVVIAFTGRLLEEKGIINLIHVVERLHKTHKNVYLLIAGDGDLEMEVEAKKSDYIIPLGRIEFEHIVALFAESDILCLPSF